MPDSTRRDNLSDAFAAEHDLRRALTRDPANRDAALALAQLLREQGRMVAASAVVMDSQHARNADADETRAALIFLRECGSYAQALTLARNALRRWPNDAVLTSFAGTFALAAGEFDAARDYLRRAIDADPRVAGNWLRLSLCQRFERTDDTELIRLQKAWTEPLAPDVRACVGFALGKAFDDLHDHARAASVLREANALARAQSRWSASAWNRFVQTQLDARSLPPVDAIEGFSPVFVVGMPRTGTTLTATLLGDSGQVRDRGELNWVDGIRSLLVEQNHLHDPAALASAARIIAAQMRRDDVPACWYLDKNPMNFRHLDFIAALFPQAKIIHCRRDARDTTLSLWTQHFAHEDLGFAYDFSDIAQVMSGHARLMARWRETLALPILDLDYETLVADTANTHRRLLEFLDLADTANTQDGATTPIVTASVWQARQPVYSSSVGRWRNYAPYLPELTALFAQ